MGVGAAESSRFHFNNRENNMANHKKRALVTGGAGLIGSHIVDLLLREGWSVRILDNLEPQTHGNGKPLWLAQRQSFNKLIFVIASQLPERYKILTWCFTKQRTAAICRRLASTFMLTARYGSDA
jgi:nucleoside-diphosphate-sugar epimerase